MAFQGYYTDALLTLRVHIKTNFITTRSWKFCDLLPRRLSSLPRLFLPVLLVFSIEAWSQMRGFVNPVPPDVFQFVKYTEMPVSEYTGIPQISVPVYTITAGDFTFPIGLSYHAGGVRVAEEASWVGLGWNLDVGNVTQLVNDRDDLQAFEKVLPEYHYNGGRYSFNWRHPYPAASATPPFGYTPSTGMNPNYPQHSFVLYMDYYFPVGGSYDLRNPGIANADGGPDEVDTEPDVFKASFNGHYLEFIRDFPTGNIVVLNRKNYKVQKLTNVGNPVWKITTPEGVEYHFEEIDEEITELSCSRMERPTVTTNCSDDASLISRTWHLTKVVTTTGAVINFTWEKGTARQDLPAVSQKVKFKDYQQSQGVSPCVGWSEIYDFRSTLISDLTGYSSSSTYYDDPLDETLMNSFFNINAPRAHSYLKEIVLPSGTLHFKRSSRLDRPGEYKLDSVVVDNGFRNVKTLVFAYNYFIADTTGRQSDQDFPSYYDYDYTPEQITHRLKLQAVREVGVPAYEFTYDAENLPVKTSYATDYWGFYNGKLTNESFIPNPIHINKPAFGDNGNDRRSYLTATRAGTITAIKYPTGGSAYFEYEMNTFDNAVGVPITSGCGLRVKSVTHSTTEAVSKTNYTYGGGKLVLPLYVTGGYNYSNLSSTVFVDATGSLTGLTMYSFHMDYISGNNFYASSLLGSGNFTGYSQVTREQVDASSNALGKTISYYHNNPDIGVHDDKSDLSLPAIKNWLVPENGLRMKSEVFDNLGTLLRKDTSIYQFQKSELFYGVRVVYSNLFFIQVKPLQAPCQTYLYEQDLAGYYPIFSGESLLLRTETTERAASNTLKLQKDYTYYSNNLVEKIDYKNSSNEVVTEQYKYPANYPITAMVTRNMLSQPIAKSKLVNGSLVFNEVSSYQLFGSLMLLRSVYADRTTNPGHLQVYIDSCDTKGNVTQLHDNTQLNQSIIWGYNKTLPVAEIKNAAVTQVAFSSFENSADLGRWTYTHTASVQFKSGNYSFAGTSISKSLLPSGNYTISFWAKRNTVNGSVSGSISQTVTHDDWRYYTYTLSAITSVNLTLSNVLIDDLRLYPSRATMTSYTHEPLIGITTQSDANGRVTYYSYDSQNRLQYIRDDRGNIVKRFDYHFKGGN